MFNRLIVINLCLTQGEAPVLLTANGAPVAEKKASLTVGPRGPMLLQDFVYLDEMSHFARERIPERVVHAKGAGMLLETIVAYYTYRFRYD